MVSTEWLFERIEDPSLVILHVGSEESYDTVHIRRSRFIPARLLMVDKENLRHELPDIERIDSVLSASGIDANSRIVLCYENERVIPLTARVFLTMDYAGLRDRTYVLNGGLKKWMDEGLPVTDTVYEFPEGELNLIANNNFLIQVEEVRLYLETPDYVILDARPPEYYSGKYDSIEMNYTGGHIEGAMNLPFEFLLSESDPYIFKDNDMMIKEFANSGMEKASTSVHYCGSGIWAAVNYLVSSHLGYKALFFDGSFEAWENLDLPIIKPVSQELLND
ncbi:MAG: sulfurtransferase [Bacteroidetes bacterium]|nr:sulfurtransferase [Bacteroidota bacterium]